MQKFTITTVLVFLVFTLLLGASQAHATPAKTSDPDYVLQRIREEAGINDNINWDTVAQRIIDGTLYLVRLARQFAHIPLAIVFVLAGGALLLGFLFSITKITRWALGVIIAAVIGWLVIQLAPAAVVWLSGFFL